MKVVLASHRLDVFSRTGDDDLIASLRSALLTAGHAVHVVAPPFDSDPRVIRSQLAMVRMIDMGGLADRVLCTTPVAMLMRHPSKVLWADGLLQHEFSPELAEIDWRATGELDRLFARTPEGGDRIASAIGERPQALAVPSDGEWDDLLSTLIDDRQDEA